MPGRITPFFEGAPLGAAAAFTPPPIYAVASIGASSHGESMGVTSPSLSPGSAIHELATI